ncbi:regulator of ime2, partial [Linnemannia elongata]
MSSVSPINGVKISGESDPSKIVKVMANEGKSGEPFEFAYTNCKVIGNGTFGVVFQARFVSNGDDAAIKKVLQDKRFK